MRRKVEKYTMATVRNAIANRDVIEKCVREGLTLEQASIETGIAAATLRRRHALLELEPFKKSRDEENLTRAQTMFELRAAGLTLDAIGKKFDLSRERVRQILARTFKDSIFPHYRHGTRVCAWCDKDFYPKKNHERHCCAQCRNMETGKLRWTREVALAVMRYRNEGLPWEAISGKLFPDIGANALRAALQKWKKVIFSIVEQETYFPARKKPE